MMKTTPSLLILMVMAVLLAGCITPQPMFRMKTPTIDLRDSKDTQIGKLDAEKSIAEDGTVTYKVKIDNTTAAASSVIQQQVPLVDAYSRLLGQANARNQEYAQEILRLRDLIGVQP